MLQASGLFLVLGLSSGGEGVAKAFYHESSNCRIIRGYGPREGNR